MIQQEKELLRQAFIKVYDNLDEVIKKEPSINTYKGICALLAHLYQVSESLTAYEYCRLTKYVNENRPSKWSSYSAYRAKGIGYFWFPGDWKIRKRWIKKQIKKLS